MFILLLSIFIVGATAGPIKKTNQCVAMDISMIDANDVNVFVFFDPTSESVLDNAQAYDHLLTDLEKVSLLNTTFYSILKETSNDQFFMDEVTSDIETIADRHSMAFIHQDNDGVQIWKKFEAKDQDIYIMNKCGGLIDRLKLQNKWRESYIQRILQIIANAQRSTCNCSEMADPIFLIDEEDIRK